MTNSTRRPRTSGMCIDCGIRRVGSNAATGVKLCDPCNEYAEWENEHSDNDHGTGPDQNQPHDCPVCFPELDPRNPVAKKGHTNTVAKSHTSHAGCSHPRTPRDRAACRKTRKANRPVHFCAGRDACLPVCTPNATDSRMAWIVDESSGVAFPDDGSDDPMGQPS